MIAGWLGTAGVKEGAEPCEGTRIRRTRPSADRLLQGGAENEPPHFPSRLDGDWRRSDQERKKQVKRLDRLRLRSMSDKCTSLIMSGELHMRHISLLRIDLKLLLINHSYERGRWRTAAQDLLRR